MRGWRRLWTTAVAVAMLAMPAAASAQGSAPLNDLLALGQGFGQTPAPVALQKPSEPPQDATPRAQCGPGSKPEPSIQGRVPAGSAAEGLWCNLTLLSHQGTSGGFKVLRYVDSAGRECAYYDTALLFPLNAFNLNSSGIGVAVLDMSNPAKPLQTATLTDPAMLSPHESLNLNAKRGLLAAVTGNPATYPGYVSIYDLSADCRRPVNTFQGPIARLGHESGFSEDGRTFYATGTATKSITAIDVTDPKAPRVLSQINEVSHGMTLSADGNRAYVADPTGRNMLILDTTQIQARTPDPQAREVSRITWDRASIPQNAIPFTRNGHPYVLEFDEYSASTLGSGNPDDVGAGRIIDIGDETAPKVVANLRLQINQPADHKRYSSDPGANVPGGGAPQGYAAHYCNLDSRTDPTLVACSFIASGLRLFDITDLTAPREVGYFVAPTQAKVENGFQPSDFAMSQPVFVPARREVWYTDGTSGFYALRVADAVWPATAAAGARKACRTTLRLRLPRGARVRSLRVIRHGKRLRVVKRRRHGRTLWVTVRHRRAGRARVRMRLAGGRRVTLRRALPACG